MVSHIGKPFVWKKLSRQRKDQLLQRSLIILVTPSAQFNDLDLDRQQGKEFFSSESHKLTYVDSLHSSAYRCSLSTWMIYVIFYLSFVLSLTIDLFAIDRLAQIIKFLKMS